MSEDFEALLQEYGQRADAYIAAILQCPTEQRKPAFVHTQLLGYVCSKFMLDPEDCHTDSLSELSAMSIARVSKIPKGELAEKDISMNCAGISSVETKKILLLITLQRALHLKLNPDLVPAILTIEDLTAVICDALPET
ncbi:MAG: hypothetical protein LUB63_02560 [Oscillospiraceae bacterium]|nr:hypothetical protein [Oscillospiraceae bacterium]